MHRHACAYLCHYTLFIIPLYARDCNTFFEYCLSICARECARAKAYPPEHKNVYKKKTPDGIFVYNSARGSTKNAHIMQHIPLRDVRKYAWNKQSVPCTLTPSERLQRNTGLILFCSHAVQLAIGRAVVRKNREHHVLRSE